MVKLIVGLKGSGKTKMLIEMVNNKIDTSDGSVVCIEKGTKLINQIRYQARLIDTDEYCIDSSKELFGFIAGVIASDHDANDIFIDSALKICKNDIYAFEDFVRKLDVIGNAHSVNFTLTSSVSKEDVPESIAKFISNV